MHELVYSDVGRSAYGAMLQLQRRLWEDVASGACDRGYLVFAEHDPPVITMGPDSQPEHLLAAPEDLANLGIEVHQVRRGGGVTYHGPGQLVGYPILNLRLCGLGVRQYLRKLEEILIRLLEKFGIEGKRIDGLTGVWVGKEKIAAIGVSVRRWVAYHGFALNVSPDMSAFGLIVPCGIVDRGVTSLQRLLGRAVSVNEVKEPLIEMMLDVFGFGLSTRAKPQEIVSGLRCGVIA